MTIKKAITIGTLSAITITLIAIGIKANAFNIKTTTPNAQHRNAIRVDAEDLYPVSKKWLMNESNIVMYTTFENTSFTTWGNIAGYDSSNNVNTATKYTCTQFTYETYDFSQGREYYINIRTNQSPAIKTWYNQYATTGNTPSHKFVNNASRIVEFTDTPTSTNYSLMNSGGLPAYNNDILIFSGATKKRYQSPNYVWEYKYKDSCINEIRKDSLHIEKTEVQSGKFINQSGVIQLFLDAGITSLKINETEYIGTGTSTINITNNDIVIESSGTQSGNTSSVFTINYFNTRPPIEPQPYPDPGEQVVEVIDIMPMMFKILTMPFTFITQAFNVTLWEGTPYAFNFSNFILSIIAIATLLFIIRLFSSGLSIIGNYSANHESKKLTKSQIELNKAKTEKIKANKTKKE